MKILQIVQFFTPERGGSVNNVYNLTKHLTEKGHEITIFTSSSEYDEKMANSLRPARVVPFKSYLGGFYYTPSMAKTLDEKIGEYDVVHLNNYWTYQNIIATRSAIKHKVPIVLSPHGSLPIMMKGYGRKLLFNLFFGRKILENASKIIAVSDMEYKQVHKKGINPGKIRVVPNAVDLPIQTPYQKGVFRKKYCISDKEKIILFLGRIHPIKGIDLLVSAFAKLSKRRNDVKLVIIGPDEGYLVSVRKQVEKMGIEDKVIFSGPLYGDDKYFAYMDADVYILPSRYEIFAISVLEACACSLPVIVTENQGIADFIRGTAGEVVRFRVEDLLQAMEKLLSDRNLSLRYGETGKKMVEDLFSWDKVVSQYEEVYKEVSK